MSVGTGARLFRVRAAPVFACAIAMLGLVIVPPAGAHSPREAPKGPGVTAPPAFLRDVGIAPRLGAELPTALVFRDHAGAADRFARHVGAVPVILSFNDWGCQNLCPITLDALARALNATALVAGRDYRVVAVSVDPWDTAVEAAAARAAFLGRLHGPGTDDATRFLTGDRGAVARLADAVGVRFTHDVRHDQWVHPAGVVVLTPDGRVGRYLLGLDHAPRDLRLALVEASAGTIGGVVDRVLLSCFRYDPALGRYSSAALGAVRAGGLLTVLGLAIFLGRLWRRERRR